MKRKLNTAEIEHIVNTFNKGRSYPLDTQSFIDHAERYIKASREHGIFCSIGSVSASGMSRTMKFFHVEKGKYNGKPRYCMLNFWILFKVLGFRSAKDIDYFVIGGCGMDMVFATNYAIIHRLCRLGFIGSKECDVLAQRTPQVL